MSTSVFYKAVQPIIAPWALVYAHQNAPRPAKPYATFHVERKIHPRFGVETKPGPSGMADVTEHVDFRMEVMFFGPASADRAALLASCLKYHSNVQRIHELGVSISTIGPPVTLNIPRGDQIEEQASLEISGYAIVAGQDDVGVIATVEVTGTTDDYVETFVIDSGEVSP